MGGGHNLGGQVQPLTEVAETSLRQGVVVVLPRELGLDKSARGERLACLDDLLLSRVSGRVSVGEVRCGTDVEVLRVNLCVLGKVEVLLSDEDSLAEEVLVDELAVGLGDEPV